MNNRLANKVIIITGGSGLLGSCIIERAKKEGAICINFDINQETTDDLSKVYCDVTDQGSVDAAIELVYYTFGRIDGLVNNAYPRTKDWGVHFRDIKFDSWEKNVSWQLNSYFYMSQKAISKMEINGYGSIVNIASIYGLVGPDFSVYDNTNMTMPAAYSAIKGGLINLTRYLASYFGPQQIRVNAVSPGGIFDQQVDSFVQQYSNKVPLRRMGTPEDISPSVTFLLSEDSKYITGQNIVVDGGWTSI
ncbi:NAD(P)-dependent dehydrogenase, short-chain alcohol dehydrogenase family [Daejeonella rubra]|uniref:NAD(P)-dependent dehydrogenase, short-chain alcohol dehydrogenase family n=1 Tax=Daejeonella rubra TaxID=990371 RepID=A0A1G9WUA8_9SPHI|nr:oxidoreductase [Daejeonella rubra]SDM87959.1 NAD(P)-dependent dehydrogenase, short-chain alcohol dehydrogenase family [Daejeonella rubra]